MNITINPMHLWVVLYHHRHGTSAQVVETAHPDGPMAEAPAEEDAQAWLCQTLFDESFNPEDDETLECVRADIATLPVAPALATPRL